MSRVFAYCRVSTHDQTTENQVREIMGAGFAVTPSRVVEETISGGVPAGDRLLIERTASGLARAKASGKSLGRPPVLNKAEVAVALHKLSMGASVASVSRDLKASRATIARIRDTAATA
jgi:DNA invertase Pin-like site-specific DNA recombinase